MNPAPWRLLTDEAGRVVVRFEGHLGAAAGRASAEALRQRLTDRRQVVLDVRAMAGYDNEARNIWVSTLLPVRAQIRGLTVVGGSVIVRMGARVLGLGLGIPVELVAKPSDLSGSSDSDMA